MDILGFEKLIYHFDKIEKLRSGKLQFPVHATLSLGNYCNHRCLWCTAYEHQKDKANIIDSNALFGWLEGAEKRGLKAVGYVGNGEPTTFPGFDELMERVHAIGLQQGMFTNGYLLDRFEEHILNFMTYIRISLDAGSPAVHARMHDVSEDHFDRIVSNIISIVNKRRNSMPTVGVQFAVHQENVDNLYAAASLASKIGIDYFSVKPVFNRGSVGERIEKNNLTLKDLAPIVADIRREFEATGIKIYFRPHQVQAEEADHNLLEYDRCIAGFFNLNIYEDGQIIYCGPHRIPVGTLDTDLSTIEKNCLELSKKLDLSKCPGGCRYHPLNNLVYTVLNPEFAERFHINFL
jgi:MoaA/NifB/PqqE/SkfB family radical SAM enzyme